jgi:tripeptide aminopeptidase
MYAIDRNAVIKTFTDLASLPSPSWEEGKVISYIEKAFKKLGGRTARYACEDSHNLLVTIPGTRKGDPFLLSAHTDTVAPAKKFTPVIKSDRIYSDGTSVLGGDDKSAIAMFLEGIRYAQKNTIPYPDVELLFSCAEEQGLRGIKCFDFSPIKSKRGVVFDSAGDIGGITLIAPYHLTMTIEAKGQAAHAGIEPEKGKNAIKALASIIAALPDGRIDSTTTMNTGLIAGGMATNIVPREAWTKLEIRAVEKTTLKKLEKAVKKTSREVGKEQSIKITITSEMDYDGYSVSENNPLVSSIARSMEKIGVTPKMEITGGGSDTNIINKNGLTAVNLSCGMEKIHSTEEYITIKNLVKGTELVVSLLERL